VIEGKDSLIEGRVEKGMMSENGLGAKMNTKGEFRVVDTGIGLTVGVVLFDPLGNPVDVNIDFLDEVESLDELRNIVIKMKESLEKPVLNMRNLW
jgi:hypothetical protein